MDLDSEDTWSDTSEEEEAVTNMPLLSRAYQMEMFNHSMKENIIAVMATGSGKTQVAKLRMEAELERSPGKMVWFTAPTVVLAYQQYRFLSQQLPAFQFRLITGMDSVDYWTTKDVWDVVLHKIQVVVSTPAVLNQALDYGFISLADISLLVFDEAHHGVKESAQNKIMTVHYHPYNVPGSDFQLPHILGLSASPITRKAASEKTVLEKNLNAICRTPLQQLDEYTAFVNMPEVIRLTYSAADQPPSKYYFALASVVSGININDDPIMKTLRTTDNPKAQSKLEKILKKNSTPAMTELRSLERSSRDIQENLGNWACDMLIKNCVEKVEKKELVILDQSAANSSPSQYYRFIKSCLQPLHEQILCNGLTISAEHDISPKVQMLLAFLQNEHCPDLSCLIFVKARNTAWLLAEVLNNHSLTRGSYKAFSFMGVRIPSHEGIFDFADLRLQHDNLERFRRGELNVCVATSVLEEGIDVPAMNLVICFDERPTFRSFIQSRGRARQKSSRLVLFQETAVKLQQWQALEDEMTQEYEDSLRELEERQRIENVHESDGEIFRVESTGATLTYSGSRQLLARFCAKLPRTDESEQSSPIFCVEGEPGVEVAAKVYLPTTLPPGLQNAESKFSWRTEKKAKQDAAFQAYLALYKAGLVTEHLLPPEWPKEADTNCSIEQKDSDDAIEKRESDYNVQSQQDPWPMLMELWTTSDIVYAHRLKVEAADCAYPTMLLLLPQKISSLNFPLVTTSSSWMQVSVSSGMEIHEFPKDLGRDITFLVLETVLGRRLQHLQKELLPFLLVPDLDLPSIRDWYQRASSNTSMSNFLETGSVHEKQYLVLSRNHHVPHVWQPVVQQKDANHHGQQLERTDGMTEIVATRLPRRLDYLTLPASTSSDTSTLLPVEDCSVLGLPVEYGRLMLLIPSITHMLEVALRTMEACKGPLLSLGFDSVDLVSEAITLPGTGSRNYQRLEFLGDVLLKFYSSLQVFVDSPNHPEGQLTLYRGRIINNARLQRATRAIGLDQYLTRTRFAANQWSIGVRDPRVRARKPPQKRLSSKTLADVVEALIGAASLSGIRSEDKEAKVLSVLSLFIDEVQWKPMSENIAKFQPPEVPSSQKHEALKPVESLIGYTFANHGFLVQALTQSAFGGHALSSYDRLEFLGDAVLDCIVSPKLFHSSLQLDPGQMTIRHHALVSHVTLAFFALQTSATRSTYDVQTDLCTKQTVSSERTETVYLPDHIRRIGNSLAPLQRRATLAAYEEVRSSVLASFETGKKFPWSALSRVGAPKCYSDVVESILGAVFLDSRGDMTACEAVLEQMGYMKLVRRLTTDKGIDVLHPEQALAHAFTKYDLIAQERKRTTTTLGDSGSGSWRCKVMVEGERIAFVKGATCKEEAQCCAAEKALAVANRKRKWETVEQQADGDGEDDDENDDEEGRDREEEMSD
ncbi:uncharacterized protein Z520_10901 [Fonsecaea multimorphosa CBS 102226]|uniref:RNase III domain-containing protein n=1 Tax=Fonsecaea multimorphosa CBS 102226 TaxID=1442371 RepID=A0A0D2I8G7_9EURO|nr:uncharacterized protein Z520_10901 [Fonsecaea multimorphosa CBS 102226]KIX93481.1 hypothetical protein Z520_10901 [Fonsecaea multimorphosa CBS 102226]